MQSLDQLNAHLERLTRELTAGGTPDGHGGPRACVLDLVVHVEGGDEELREVGEAIGKIAPSHPLRAVVVRTREDATELSADLLCEAYGGGVQRQEVTLTMPSAAASRLLDEISVLLVSEVPVFVWLLIAPNLADPENIDTLSRADGLIVESSTFARPAQELRDLSRFGGRGRSAVVDLTWARLRSWREEMAGFFAPSGRRQLIAHVDELRVEQGTGAAGTMAGALLVGWMASRFGYVLEDVSAAGAHRSVVRYRREDGRAVQVRVDGVDGDWLQSVEVRGRGFEFGVRVDSETGAELRFHIGHTVTQHLSWPRPSRGELLGELLIDPGHDPVYLAALAAACDLLEAPR